LSATPIFEVPFYIAIHALTTTEIIRQKGQSFDEHNWSSKLVWKIMDSTKVRPAYCELFALKWVQQWVKKGWKSRLQ
jgi:hypothetical protein